MYIPFPIFVKSDKDSRLIVNAFLKSGLISSVRLTFGLEAVYE